MTLTTLPPAARLYDVIYLCGSAPEGFTHEWMYVSRTAATFFEGLKIRRGDKEQLSKHLNNRITDLPLAHPLQRMSHSERSKFIIDRVARSYMAPISD